MHAQNFVAPVPDDPTTGGIFNLTYNLNSPFEPISGSSVYRAQNFSIFANIYNRYYVTGATIEVNLIPSTSKVADPRTVDNEMGYVVNIAAGDLGT